MLLGGKQPGYLGLKLYTGACADIGQTDWEMELNRQKKRSAIQMNPTSNMARWEQCLVCEIWCQSIYNICKNICKLLAKLFAMPFQCSKETTHDVVQRVQVSSNSLSLSTWSWSSTRNIVALLGSLVNKYKDWTGDPLSVGYLHITQWTSRCWILQPSNAFAEFVFNSFSYC